MSAFKSHCRELSIAGGPEIDPQFVDFTSTAVIVMLLSLKKRHGR